MKNIKKAVCLCLTAVILTLSAVSCGNKMPISTGDKRIVVTIGEFDVSYDFYRYLFLNTANKMNVANNMIAEYKEEIDEYVLTSLLTSYSVFALAKEYGITLTKDEKAEIEEYVSDSKGTMSDEEYENTLSENFLTEKVAEFAYGIQYLENIVYSEITSETSGIITADDATVDKAIENDFVRAKHILISYTTENVEEKANLANSINTELQNGADFDTLMETYSEDTSTSGGETGYYFTYGEFDENIENAVFGLNIGEVSGVVVSSDAFHFFKRMPLEQSYIDKNYETLRSEYITSRYYALKDKKIEELKNSVKYSDDFSSCDFVNNK